MDARTKIGIGVAAVFVATLFLCVGQQRRIRQLTDERDRYKGNSIVLLSDVEHYKVQDSLNAARVSSLELTIKEFEKFRAQDAEIINALKRKNRDLSAVNEAQLETIYELSAIPHDTVVIIRDSIQIPAIALNCGDAWYDFKGILTETEFTGTMHSRDSLLLAETVRYKRFLGFLWKTKKIKDRQLDCVSKNPHNTIVGLEYITIEQ